MSIKNRLERLEKENEENCPECAGIRPKPLAYWPEGQLPGGTPEEAPEVPECSRCGRALGILLACVYDKEGPNLREDLIG
jgi:hypothetical protein